ncbi:hypothetical protein AZOA_43950 [Azoarcus sp. Aa7]|nr:hypothetical protein [Azoarcus sp. Aa7]
MIHALRQLFDLRPDQDDAAAIDATIRKGVRIGGTNLWVLMFAILIASVGLNVNSTAVVIGAMLVSPLMGPIVGLGYGAGINDSALIRQSLRSLGIFVALSLATSALYFLLSPLSQAQSELLARTTPTLWDVLIAFFGGAAGIVALTRKDISTVVPGVAIATALMPPLCTAGYGLASGNATYFLGAFYLFSINSVFIALATLLFVKLLKLPQHVYPDDRVRRRHRLLIGAAVLATLLPSAWLTYRLVENEIFATAAHRLLTELDADPRFIVLATRISPAERKISLTLGGDVPPADLTRRLEGRLAELDLAGSRIQMRHLGSDKFDVAALKRELQEDLSGATLRLIEERNARIRARDDEGHRLQAEFTDRAALIREIHTQLPEATSVVVTLGERSSSGDSSPRSIIVAVVTTSGSIAEASRNRLADWLNARLANQEILLRFESHADIVATE